MVERGEEWRGGEEKGKERRKERKGKGREGKTEGKGRKKGRKGEKRVDGKCGIENFNFSSDTFLCHLNFVTI
jgi:hypothetical protein